MRTPSSRRWLWILVPVAILALAITFSLRDAIRDLIVVPLAYVAWFADLVLASVPQAAYLAVLVLAGVALAARVLFPVWRERPAASRPARENAEPSRLRFWLRHLKQLDRSTFSREKVAVDLKELVLDALAGQEDAARSDAEARIVSGQAGVPAEVEELVMAEARWLGELPTGRADRLKAWLRARAGRRARPSVDRVASVVAFIERAIDTPSEKGEAQNDTRSR